MTQRSGHLIRRRASSHVWMRVLARLAQAVALGWLLCMSWAQAAPQAGLQTIPQAEFRADGQQAWTPVALPDTWTLRGLPGRGQGEYHLTVRLEAAPVLPWALYADRLSTVRMVWVNGVLVDQRAPEARVWLEPALVRLPPGVLRTGANDIQVQVLHRFRGGLSTLQIGPAEQAEFALAQSRLWEQDIPLQLNLAAGVLALLLLLIRWRQPAEKAIGLFGLLGLVSSVRNYGYHVGGWHVSPHVNDAMAFVAMVWIAVLFFAYVHCLRHGQPPRWRGPFGAAMAAAPLLAFLLPDAWLSPVRVTSYSLQGLYALRVLRDAAQAGRGVRWPVRLALALCLLGPVAAALHDFAYQILGWLPITSQILLPWAFPLALISYSMLLLARLFDAMTQVDKLNRTLEERVEQRTQALDAANEAKSHFLATASHDLRQPLVSVALLWGLLQEEAQRLASGHAIRKLLAQMGQAISSMEELLKSLLDFSRLEAQERPPLLRAVPLAELARTIVEEARPQALQRGLQLRLRLPRESREGPREPLAAQSEAVLLEQMLRNLVHNAVRYTEQGGVLVAVRRRKQGVELSVWDTGPGIPLQDQQRIFEPFLQLGNPGRTSREGWGLGLTIVRRGSERLGHALQLRSVPGHGSCFRLWMADAAPSAQDLPTQPTTPGTTANTQITQSPSLHARTVWLVEDEDSVRNALSLRFSQWGASVTAFANAQALREGLEQAQAWPDLLVCDARLPDGNGLDLVATVREDAPVPVAALLVTGDTAPSQLLAQQRAGIPVLHKPFGTEALWQAVQQALQTALMQT